MTTQEKNEIKDVIKNEFQKLQDKEPILFKLAKWIVNNSVSLLAIPITVLAIIVSLHTDLFKETSKTVETPDYFKIGTYYKLFKKQKEQQISNFPPHRFTYIEDTASYSHLLFIDRTLSTENSAIENLLSNLKTFVRDTLSYKEDKFLNKPTDNKLKNIILHYFLQNLLPDDKLPHKINKLYVCFFNGKGCESYKFHKIDGSEYNSDAVLNFETKKEEEIRMLLGDLLKEKLYKKEINQKSNFKTLFKTIHDKCNMQEFNNEKIIVTIISDFDHDFDNTSEKQWNRIINDYFSGEVGNLRQYNLIVFPTTSSDKKQKAEKLLNILKRHTSSNNNIINISLDDFYNDNLDNFDKENFKNRISASFYSIKNAKAETLTFHYPKENTLGVKIANAKIQYDQIQAWRIVTESYQEESDKSFSYTINKREYNGKINSDFINNTTNTDVITIEIKFDPKTDTEKYRIEIVTNKGNIISYPIGFNEYMQGSLPDFGKWLLNIFCIILMVILTSLALVLFSTESMESVITSLFVFGSMLTILSLMGFWNSGCFPLTTVIISCFLVLITLIGTIFIIIEA